MNHLTLSSITKLFGEVTALNNIDFSVEKGEFICLLGPSGCGKTTLLRMIAGLEEPSNGAIYVSGKNITQLPPAKRNFGIVFQSYALFPNLTAYQNVAYGLKTRKFAKKQRADKVHEMLSLVNLSHVSNRYPSELSGGQQQRIALARALAFSPDFLLLDEPLSALDAKVRESLRNQIKELQQRLGITTIMVTHDQEEALTMADKIVVMNNATIEQMGTPQEVYDYPATPFVAEFIGAMNLLDDDHLQVFGGGKPSIAGIRPEHVKLTVNSSSSVAGQLRNLEFRGSFYRGILSLPLSNDSLWIDIPAQLVKERNLGIGSTVNVELPKDHFIFYDKESRSGENVISVS